jgi:hypothetical protein
MIPKKRVILAVVAVAIVVACQHPSSTPTGTGPAAKPATVAQTPAAQPGAAVTPRPRPPRLSPDSLSKLRRIMVNQVLASIAGRENEPAGTVFRNVKYNRDMPAAQFVNMMDSSYGRSLGWQCANCHVTTDFSSDAKKDKGLAKLMIEMTQRINKEDMPRISAQNPHTVTCMLCHRGTNDPKDSVEVYRMPAAPVTRPPGGSR